MALTEFDIIQRYFEGLTPHPAAVTLGIGDDAAVLDLAILQAQGKHLVISADTYTESTHFLPDAAAADIGYKSLAVNISDILAMGAEPVAFTLCLTLPHIDHAWLQEYVYGLQEAAMAYGVALIGGDTTRGQLAMSIQIFGVCKDKPLLRSGAKTGDYIAVTGCLGDAAAGLQETLRSAGAELHADGTYHARDADQVAASRYLIHRFNRPTPRAGLVNAGIAGVNACIDISDGFLADLEHICRASQLTAEVDPALVPTSSALQQQVQDPLSLALVGGEDYELCLVYAPQAEKQLMQRARALGISLTRVGVMKSFAHQQDLVSLAGWSSESIATLKESSFRHFADNQSTDKKQT